ncbi:putative secreted protein [Rhodopirellula sallentina SM41]|uniref:Putative secreted protein n=1 Tax=Rhodopirellula sallentina SM41 TaxID=1263870 RepID=M5TVF6_9BACT|nr:putative secreted protein [Rhodopirellula sallentina SM41]
MNVPAAMHSVRCPTCGNVFAASASAQAAAPADNREDAALRGAAGPQDDDADSIPNDQTMTIIAVGAGLALVAILCIVGIWSLTRSSEDSAGEVAAEPPQPVFAEATPEELAALTIVNIPEQQRRDIYNDVRGSARTTTEKALVLPGSNVRDKLENMLDKTHENTLRQLAALHDLSVDQVRDIVAEGDTKNWDTRARSRAYRDGERIYSDEETQGYQQKSPLR